MSRGKKAPVEEEREDEELEELDDEDEPLLSGYVDESGQLLAHGTAVENYFNQGKLKSRRKRAGGTRTKK